MSTITDVATLKADMENMKNYIKQLEKSRDDQWSAIGLLTRHVYIGIGIMMAVDAFAVLWVAFYHH